MRTFASTLAALLLPALAAAQPNLDAEHLPAASGRVAEFSLTPNGDVDGLILDDGTEIHTPPHLGPRLVEIVHPGDQVVAHGLRARSIPVMDAVTITNTGSGLSVTETGSSPPKPPHDVVSEKASVTGTIRIPLHGPKGDLNGALLDNGTIIRMPPSVALRVADQLRPGQPFTGTGRAVTNPFGRVVSVDRLGPETPRPPIPRPEPAPTKGGPRP